MNIKPLQDAPISRQFWILLMLFFICIGVFQLIAALVIIPFAHIDSIEDVNDLLAAKDAQSILILKVIQLISAIGSFIVPAHVFSLLVSDDYQGYLKLNKLFSFKIMVYTVLLIIVLNPLINWMADINSQFTLPAFLADFERWMKTSEEQAKQLTEAFLKMETTGDLLLNIFIIGFIAALAEEFFFRGVVQKLLIQWTKNVHLGIWLAAILFSAIHLQFYGFIPRTALGALLGYLFVWSNSLWLPILAHFINNGSAVLISYLVQKKIVSDNLETVGNNSGEQLYLFISVVLGSFFMFMIYKEYNKNKPTQTE